MSKLPKLPAIMFYPGDWLKDINVQSLDYFEQGVWFKLICFMHESENRGKLSLNGAPMSDEVVAKLLGLSVEKTKNSIELLLKHAVASRDSEGFLYCRRLVKDQEIREVRRVAGGQGGRPKAKQKQNKSKTKANSEAKQKQNTEIEYVIENENVSINSNKELTQTALWKGCEFLRMTQEEARKVLAVYKNRKYPIELLTFAVEVVDGWLAGTTTEALKARKQESHYRRLYAEWVLKKAQGLYKLADKPAGGEQRLTSTQKAEKLLRNAKLEEDYDKGAGSRDVALYGSHVASNGSERVSAAGADGSLFGGRARVDEEGNITLSKSGVSTVD